MQATVSFERLYLPHSGKDKTGKRQYVIRVIDEIDLRNIRACIGDDELRDLRKLSQLFLGLKDNEITSALEIDRIEEVPYHD